MLLSRFFTLSAFFNITLSKDHNEMAAVAGNGAGVNVPSQGTSVHSATERNNFADNCCQISMALKSLSQ